MRRPISILIVVVALWMAAGIAMIVGIALLLPGTSLDKMWEYNRAAQAAFHTLGRALGAAFIALAFIAGGAARGLLRGRRWAWWLAVGIFAVSGLGDMIGFIQTRDLVRSGSGVLVAAVFLGLLLLNRRDHSGSR